MARNFEGEIDTYCVGLGISEKDAKEYAGLVLMCALKAIMNESYAWEIERAMQMMRLTEQGDSETMEMFPPTYWNVRDLYGDSAPDGVILNPVFGVRANDPGLENIRQGVQLAFTKRFG